MRSSACDTHFRHCVRSVLCWLAFPLAPALGSTGSAVAETSLFVGFTATMAESDFSRPCIIGYGSSPSRCGPTAVANRSIAGFVSVEIEKGAALLPLGDQHRPIKHIYGAGYALKRLVKMGPVETSAPTDIEPGPVPNSRRRRWRWGFCCQLNGQARTTFLCA